MYWQRTCALALSCIMLASVAHADIIPPDGQPLYRGKMEMFFDRLPAGMVISYVSAYSAKTTTLGEKRILTIGEPGTLYAAHDAIATGGTANTKKGKMYQLKRYQKFDLPVSRWVPDPIEHFTCAVTGNASSGYELSCRPDNSR